jgi:hypothetical protein
VGTYASPYRDDLVLHFRATVVDRGDWSPSDEIIDCRAFPPTELPEPMRPHTVARVKDGLSGRTGIFRILVSPDEAIDL